MVFRKATAIVIMAVARVPALAAGDPEFHGLLRARDLSPFGYLRLDMRPGFSGAPARGKWTIETDFAYQNTWATSPEVEKYLNSLGGRRELGPDQLQAIRDLPGENKSGLSYQEASAEVPLETCETMNGSWGFNITDNSHKSVKTLVHLLVKAAGYNANLLWQLYTKWAKT